MNLTQKILPADEALLLKTAAFELVLRILNFHIVTVYVTLEEKRDQRLSLLQVRQ